MAEHTDVQAPDLATPAATPAATAPVAEPVGKDVQTPVSEAAAPARPERDLSLIHI